MSNRPDTPKRSAGVPFAGALLSLALCWLLYSPVLAGEPMPDASRTDFDSLFEVVGRMYGLDAALLKAIAAVETGGDANAVSPAGAEGLMQLMPETAKRFGVIDPFDPISNTLGAARFLSYLSRRQRGDPDLVHLPELIAAYNAGPGAVEKYGGVPPYRETHEYVRRVLWEYLLGCPPPASVMSHGPVSAEPGKDRPSRAKSAARRSGDLELLDQLAGIRQGRELARKRNLSNPSGLPAR